MPRRFASAPRASRRPPQAVTPEERARLAQAWLDASQPKRARETADAALDAMPRGERDKTRRRRRARRPSCARRPRLEARRRRGRCLGEGHRAMRQGGCAGDRALLRAQGELLGAPQCRGARPLRKGREAIPRASPRRRRALPLGAARRERGRARRALRCWRRSPMRIRKETWGSKRCSGSRSTSSGPRPRWRPLHARSRSRPRARGARGARRAEYFRARVAELAGEADDAKTRYAALVADAAARVLHAARVRAPAADRRRAGALDPAGRRGARAGGPLSSPRIIPSSRRRRSSDSSACSRSARSTPRAAKRAPAGLIAEGVDPAVLWTIAWLYNRAGRAGARSLVRARPARRLSRALAGRAVETGVGGGVSRAFDAVVDARERLDAAFPRRSRGQSCAKSPRSTPKPRASRTPSASCSSWRGRRGSSRTTRSSPSTSRRFTGPRSRSRSARACSRRLARVVPEPPGLRDRRLQRRLGRGAPWLRQHGGDDFDVFVEHIPFDETRNYVKHVLASEAAYAYLYAPPVLDEILAMPAHLVAPQTVATP